MIIMIMIMMKTKYGEGKEIEDILQHDNQGDGDDAGDGGGDDGGGDAGDAGGDYGGGDGGYAGGDDGGVDQAFYPVYCLAFLKFGHW